MVYAVIDTNIFVSALISTIIEHVKENGIDSSRFPYDGEMPDEDDRVFYEVCLSKEDSFLVTGNLKRKKVTRGTAPKSAEASST